jgi:hypothetical protein
MSGASTEKKRRRRAALFQQQGGLCFWCQCEMQLLPPVPRRKRMPKDLCTIDHLRDRYHPERRQRCKPGEQRLVAACWECNNRRGQERTAQMSKRTLNRRSQRHPLPTNERAPYGPQANAGATMADVWPT